MGDIGNGYGSKWHLLNFLKSDNRRELLNAIIKNQTGLKGEFQWKFPDPETLSTEYRGVDFLIDDFKKEEFDEIKRKWDKFWVKGRNPQNWDGVIKIGEGEKYILVEAKAHLGEIKSSCTAEEQGKGGKKQIQEALSKTKKHFGVKTENDWQVDYYQLANRLAFIYFLKDEFDIEADLLYFYFLNGYETTEDNRNYKSVPLANKWDKAIHKEYEYLGLYGTRALERVHKVFINVLEQRMK